MFDVLDEINYQSYNDFVLRVGTWPRAVPSFVPAHPSCTGSGSWWPELSPGSGGHRSRLPCLTGRRMAPPRGVHGTQGQLGPPQSWLSVTEDLEESLYSLGNAGEILIVLEILRYTSESTLSWRKVPLSTGRKHWGRGCAEAQGAGSAWVFGPPGFPALPASEEGNHLESKLRSSSYQTCRVSVFSLKFTFSWEYRFTRKICISRGYS